MNNLFLQGILLYLILQRPDVHYGREEINKNTSRNCSNILESQAETGETDQG